MKKIFLIVIAFICTQQFVVAQNNSAEEIYKGARAEAFNNNNYSKAIQLAKQVLNQRPDYKEVHLFLGRLYAWTKQPDSARLHFNRILKDEPRNEEALNASYDLEFTQKNYGFALVHAENGLRFFPQSEDFVIKKVKALQALGKQGEALQVLSAYLSKKPNSSAAIAIEKSIRNTGGFINPTLQVNSSVQDTSTSDGLLQLARTEAFEQKNYPNAISALKKGLSLSPNYADLRIFLGRIYTWTDKVDSARMQFQQVLSRDPSNADALSAYFDLEYWNNQTEAALQLAEKGLESYPASEEFIVKKAKALNEMGRINEAKAFLSASLNKNSDLKTAAELLTSLQSSPTPSDSKDEIGSDSLFILARAAAFDEKNYPKAIALAKLSLIKSENNEVKIFLGRLYNWSDEPDSARHIFASVLEKAPQNQEALSAAYDLELWNDKPAAALELTEKALKYYPDSEDFTLKKIKALAALQKTQEATEIANRFLTRFPENKNVLQAKQSLRDQNPINSISAGHTFVHFDERFDKPWLLSSITYGRRVKFGSLNFTLNHANRFNTNGFEGEIETYISIIDGLYSYLGGGISGSDIFSNHRVGFSLYKSLPWSFEAEAGVRYLQFTDATFVYVVGIGKYVGNAFFGLRSYLTPSSEKDSPISASVNLSARFYTGDDRFGSFGFAVGTGTSPDDRARRIFLENNFRTIKAGADYSVNIFRRTTLALGASWANEEYQTETFGNQYSFSASLSHRF